jgi:hypothetical protein
MGCTDAAGQARIKHLRRAGRLAGRVDAVGAGPLLSHQDWRARRCTQSQGCSAQHAIGTSRDAVATTRAASQKCGFVDGARRTQERHTAYGTDCDGRRARRGHQCGCCRATPATQEIAAAQDHWRRQTRRQRCRNRPGSRPPTGTPTHPESPPKARLPGTHGVKPPGRLCHWSSLAWVAWHCAQELRSG